MRVTLKQIADRAGVSRPAVSAVLNNARGRMAVSEETRQHIKKIASKMGYVPNLSAQMLSGKRSQVIGIVNMSFPGNVTEEFFSNLSSFFNGRDYHMLVDSDVGRNIRRGGWSPGRVGHVEVEPPTRFAARSAGHRKRDHDTQQMQAGVHVGQMAQDLDEARKRLNIQPPLAYQRVHDMMRSEGIDPYGVIGAQAA